MRCIFCKSDSSTSKAIEHIIPESLGNIEHVLPPGIVCDKCNNYFSRKIEKPLLESNYFVEARFRNEIQSKRGRVPNLKGVHLESGTIIEMDNNGEGAIYPSKDKDITKFMDNVFKLRKGTLIFPKSDEPDNNLMSRFLGKVAIEALASRFLGISEALDELIDKKELDQLRSYVREGKPDLFWPYHHRKIYPEDAKFHEENYGTYEVLHEYNFIYTNDIELYFIVAIFGVEYALNLDKPDTASYITWLNKNNNKSPLYP